MTRVLFLLFCTLLLVGCNGAKQEEGKIQESVEKEVSTVENIEKDSVIEDDSEEVVLPIEEEITVDLNGQEVWEAFDGVEIINLHGDGEKLFMFDDAQALEDKVIAEFEKSEHDGTLMKWGAYVDLFIADTKDFHPEQSDYYDKLSDAIKLIHDDGEKSLIADKLKEAKELRTALD